MNVRMCVAAAVIACLPISVLAAEPDKLPATPRAEIHFTPTTERAFDRSGRHVKVDERPDGTRLINLNGSFQNVSVARIGPGGAIETLCTTSEEAAKTWMAREGDTNVGVGTAVDQPAVQP
jgi:hypothetical protein